MQMMLAREESASPLAIELQARNVERDRMRKRRLMMTDMLRPLLPALTCPISAIFGSEDPLYRHRRDFLHDVLVTAPEFQTLTWIEGSGHWVQFEDAVSFNEALASQLSMSISPVD